MIKNSNQSEISINGDPYSPIEIAQHIKSALTELSLHLHYLLQDLETSIAKVSVYKNYRDGITSVFSNKYSALIKNVETYPNALSGNSLYETVTDILWLSEFILTIATSDQTKQISEEMRDSASSLYLVLDYKPRKQLANGFDVNEVEKIISFRNSLATDPDLIAKITPNEAKNWFDRMRQQVAMVKSQVILPG